jgi:predicted hydrolase (HD superfamily)
MLKFKYLRNDEIVAIHLDRVATKTRRHKVIGDINSCSVKEMLKKNFKNKNITKAITSAFNMFDEDCATRRFNKVQFYYCQTYGYQIEIGFVHGFELEGV